MAKAKREVEQKLKQVDVVLELLDARIPYSSRNPIIDEIVQKKERIVLLNKYDLADAIVTSRWADYFKQNGLLSIPIDSIKGTNIKKIPDLIKKILLPIHKNLQSKGVSPRSPRVMILGIPNVGKSSLINRLVNRNITKTGNKPGITTHQQWIKINRDLEILDTPGILWPKFEDQEVGIRLALTGAIKDELLNKDDLGIYLISFLQNKYPDLLNIRFPQIELKSDPATTISQIGTMRGILVTGGKVDFTKTCEMLVNEFRLGKLGKISLEEPLL